MAPSVSTTAPSTTTLDFSPQTTTTASSTQTTLALRNCSNFENTMCMSRSDDNICLLLPHLRSFGRGLLVIILFCFIWFFVWIFSFLLLFVCKLIDFLYSYNWFSLFLEHGYCGLYQGDCVCYPSGEIEIVFSCFWKIWVFELHFFFSCFLFDNSLNLFF